MKKLAKQTIAVLIIAVALLATCAADSINPFFIAIIYAVAFILWDILNLNEIHQDKKNTKLLDN